MGAKANNERIQAELFDPVGASCIRREAQPDFSFLRPLKPTVVFSTYWRFAVERQEIYFRRLRGQPQPWSSDPVMCSHKFTNAYRATDRVSQYLIRHIIGEDQRDPEDTFFRILLFKVFNKIDTWELLSAAIGDLTVESFDVQHYDRVLTDAFARGERIYSAAYIMPSGGKHCLRRKHTMHLHLLKDMVRKELPARVCEAETMEQAFSLLRSWPTLGDFLSYQFVTDLNYSRITNFQESEFVAPGPGAAGGLQKCFSDSGGLTGADVIRLVAECQEQCLKAVGLRFATLWGRPLQLIDCQNLFCEVNKYARLVHPDFQERAGRTQIKQRLRPLGALAPPMFPAKWGLNSRLGESPKYVPGS
jgi:hypothetical protein